MEELLASQPTRTLILFRGQEVEGDIVAKSDKEIVLDLGAKSEGIISTRDIHQDQLETLKVGDKIKAYVVISENESGQVVLSLEPQVMGSKQDQLNWTKFISAQNQKTKLSGKVVEINKGGLIVEVSRMRGFLPNSQVGFELLTKSTHGLTDLIGQTLNVSVVEVDQVNSRLIFSQRGQVSEDILQKLKAFKSGQKIKNKCVAILPFGLVLDLGGVEGLVFISDVSWDKVDDLSQIFQVGQLIEAQVLSLDEDLGRVNLSIKHLTVDPFIKAAEKYHADDVVKGEVTAVSSQGVLVRLEDGAEGFLPASKMDAERSYEKGETLTLLIDTVDVGRRRINLTPFVTTTKGLIYK